MIEQRERLQAEAVEKIENEIKAAQAIHEEQMNFMDRLRASWNKLAYQSTLGTWGVKAFQTLIVLAAMHTSFQYGFGDKGSLLNDVFALLPESLSGNSITILAVELLLSLIWLWEGTLGTFLCAAFLYLCFAGISPIALALAFIILMMIQFEDRAVTSLLIALPVLVFLSPLNISLLVVICAAFISTRNHNGMVKTMGFVYFALLELSNGFFGTIYNAVGKQMIPAENSGSSVAKTLGQCLKLAGSGKAADGLLKDIAILLAVFFAIGAVFSKLLNMRYPNSPRSSEKQLQIDVKDGIIFASLALLLCAAPKAISGFTPWVDFGYSYASVVLQTVAAYILTRMIAGKSPKRGDGIIGGDRNYIFISYAHSDLDRVKPYLNILKQKGYEFWYDDSIKTGTEWQGIIATNLKNCACFLAFISNASVLSDYCLKEINYATSRQKPMAVIMLDDVMLPPVLEMHLASLQAVQRGKFASDTDCMQKVFEMEQLKNCKY